MYETHFGFHRQPFQSADACRAFFVSESIREILPQLIHALRSDLGVAVLTGVPGSGKTSLLRHIQQQLSSDGRVIVCSGANLGTSSDLIGVLLQASRLTGGSENAINGLAVDQMPQVSRSFAFDHMKRTAELWGPILLLIDDAQLVPLSVLNELRACTEEEWNGRDLVRCLVSAPISFEEQLARPEYAEFSRRIRCHAFLQPLKSGESIRFLKEQIELVGGQLSNVFTTTALELIATAADGIPRCLGLLADESLVVAAAAGEKIATEQSVRTALSRLQHLQYNWNASPHDDVADESSMESEPAEFEATHASASPVATPTVAPAATPRAKKPHTPVQATLAPGIIEFGGPATSSTSTIHAKSLVAVPPPIPVTESFTPTTDSSDMEPTENVPRDEHVLESHSIEPDDNTALAELPDSSQQVVEFGSFDNANAPQHSIVEFGASQSESEDVTDKNPESLNTTFREFEVGRRFVSESSQESISIDDVEDSDILNLLNLEGPLDMEDPISNPEPLQAADEVTDIAETKIVWFNGNGDEPVPSADNDFENIAEIEPEESSPCNVDSTTEETPSERSPGVLYSTSSNRLFDISKARLSDRTPVFDRYTWLALGRDVPSGSSSVVSITKTKQLMLADYGMLPMQQRIAMTAVAAYSQHRTFMEQIPITQTDDATLIDEMRQYSSGAESGSYLAIRGDDAHVAEVDSASDASTTPAEAPMTSEVSDAIAHSPSYAELNSARKIIEFTDAAADSQADSKASWAMQSPTNAPSASGLRLWQDGMLVFSEPAGRDAENVPESITENDQAEFLELDQSDPNVSEPDNREPEEIDLVESTISQQTTESQKSIALGPGGFFTLPVSDQKGHDDLHSIGIAEHEDVFPFVEAIKSLRADMRGFQNSGTVPGADSDATPRQGTPASEHVSPPENVISQAKRRLDSQESLIDSPAIALQMVPDQHRPKASSSAIESIPVADAAINGDKSPQFSKLFTRLWENRKRTADQFEKGQDRILTSGCVSEEC